MRSTTLESERLTPIPRCPLCRCPIVADSPSIGDAAVFGLDGAAWHVCCASRVLMGVDAEMTLDRTLRTRILRRTSRSAMRRRLRR